MFKVGDKVRHVAANVVGTVVEIDGETVYLEQDNGAEVDFAAASLVLEDAYQAKHDTSVRDDASSRAHDALYESVMTNLYPAIVEMGQLAHSRVKPAPGVPAKSWDALSALQKLNAISEATDVPVKAWIDANRPGAKPAIGPLQLSVLSALNKKT